jgi:hypothetical protein
MSRHLRLVVIGIVVLFAVAAIGIALIPRTAQAQSSNQNMRALIQSLVDNNQRFTIAGLAQNFDVDGSTIAVSDLGDDFFCVSGSGVTDYMARPVQTACYSFGALAIFVP